MQSCVSRNGVNPQGLFGLYPRKREYLGGCESADHPKITPTAEDLLRPNYLFGSGSAGLGIFRKVVKHRRVLDQDTVPYTLVRRPGDKQIKQYGVIRLRLGIAYPRM